MYESICYARKMRVEASGGKVGHKMYNYNYIAVLSSRH